VLRSLRRGTRTSFASVVDAGTSQRKRRVATSAPARVLR
jgi:hypothetical protein